ncbi:MAG TPA: hypothetical protein P5162_10445 [Bacteroidia bacterium]|nr:hypothetical protein [Bacteroidia bacterium]
MRIVPDTRQSAVLYGRIKRYLAGLLIIFEVRQRPLGLRVRGGNVGDLNFLF